jgi:protein-tyrosine-phosphatase
MPSILFVCLANRFRSPLAAAFFNLGLNQAGALATLGNWYVSSVGTWTKPGLPADTRAIQDAKNWGLDISGHRSRQVDAGILAQNDLVLVMEAGQKEALQVEFPKEHAKIFLLSEVADGTCYDIPDPFGPKGVPHQEIAVELHGLITRGLNNICNIALNSRNGEH